MSSIRNYPMTSSAVLRINHIRNRIQSDPPYQRQGAVWDRYKKQLLLDSILNDYDIPKLYFHALNPEQKAAVGNEFDYAIIDGRQRLEAIWEFINDEWSLDTEFVLFADPSVKAGGLRYSDLAKAYPDLKVFLDSFNLPIVLVETDDLDLIDDMFSRLNEAVPLNAAEKRNAIGGPLAQAIRDIAERPLFADRMQVSNRRYRHREIAGRLLYLEYSRTVLKKIGDTKKQFLDKMVERFKTSDDVSLRREIIAKCVETTDGLGGIFHTKDELLSSQSGVIVFYLVYQLAKYSNQLHLFTRDAIAAFQEKVAENRRLAEDDLSSANYELLEFERMSQQGTNDGSSIRERSKTMAVSLGIEYSAEVLM
jgi:hypothetical protein